MGVSLSIIRVGSRDLKEITEPPFHEHQERGNEDKERYSYYSLFPKICKTLQLEIEDWNHIDLLPFRQRDQNRLISDFQLGTNISDWVIGGNTKKDIIKDCVSIFLGLVEYLKPKVIVVVNGFLLSSYEGFKPTKRRSLFIMFVSY